MCCICFVCVCLFYLRVNNPQAKIHFPVKLMFTDFLYTIKALYKILGTLQFMSSASGFEFKAFHCNLFLLRAITLDGNWKTFASNLCVYILCVLAYFQFESSWVVCNLVLFDMVSFCRTYWAAKFCVFQSFEKSFFGFSSLFIVSCFH